MKRHKDRNSVRLLFLALMALALVATQALAQPTNQKEKKVASSAKFVGTFRLG